MVSALPKQIFLRFPYSPRHPFTDTDIYTTTYSRSVAENACHRTAASNPVTIVNWSGNNCSGSSRQCTNIARHTCCKSSRRDYSSSRFIGLFFYETELGIVLKPEGSTKCGNICEIEQRRADLYQRRFPGSQRVSMGFVSGLYVC